MKKKKLTYTHIPETVIGDDPVANIAFLLLETTGSIDGRLTCRMPAATQRALWGKFLGKGTLYIDGKRETITHSKKIAYGMDFETDETAFRDLPRHLNR